MCFFVSIHSTNSEIIQYNSSVFTYVIPMCNQAISTPHLHGFDKAAHWFHIILAFPLWDLETVHMGAEWVPPMSRQKQICCSSTSFLAL